jgi:glycopeptide antibiotics resistance protein
MQLVGRRGLFEFDDIIDNGVGTVVGVLLYFVMRWIVEKALPPNDDVKTI